MKGKTHRLFACGTTPWEMVRGNDGPMEFYASAAACSDDRTCSDSCGIVEFEVVQKRTVRKGTTCKGTPIAEYKIAERASVRIANDLVAYALQKCDDDKTARSALTRALAHFVMKSRRARAKKRLRAQGKK